MKKRTVIFTFFLLFNQAFCVDPSYESCVPKDCGDGRNISYPFFIQGLQDSSCGYPGFQLHCDNSSSIIRISDNDYVIKHIQYENQSLRLQNAAISVNRTESCPSKIRNLTLDVNRFRIDNRTTSKLVIISNCSVNLTAGLEKYSVRSCGRGNNDVVMLDSDKNLRNVTDMCGDGSAIVQMPVDLSGDYGRSVVVDGDNYPEVVETGFVLHWLAADCGGCLSSGGRCGFNKTTFGFLCFCPDRPHMVSCIPEKSNRKRIIIGGEILHVSEIQRDAKELPLFTFSTVDKATNSFSSNNKIGEGGFGPVYKGILEESGIEIEIAVKRLSKTSRQGLEEFKNEVIFISKLQHRNLVKLLGCSIQGDEMLLIYEYMPNKSLDSYIFDKTRSMLLTWSTRFNIIKGIARGLLYLHQDSRLRIIHRDLKASNVLLDLDMNPKISDFGMARSFGGNETQANTERVVGTYGYMSPEYALDGVFSIKSDVFSFGVLVLEIVSGMRNRGFIHPEHDNNLIGHAWRMHNEGRSMELIDTTLGQSINSSEVIKSIIVGLLCVQQSPEDRPIMSSVVLMLGNEGALLKPKQPGFFVERILDGGNISSSSCPTSSTKVVGR